uniref:Uncharacterized protein n=1 Tax=Rhizophora mucronata TaxID=61149 RepID=A0A2P2PDV0_RHIMU
MDPRLFNRENNNSQTGMFHSLN